MPDALAISGIIIGLPGVVDLLVKYGKWLKDRATTAVHAKAIWEELSGIGDSLSEGQFKLYVEKANEAYLMPGLNQTLKASLASQLQRLELDLDRAQKVLERIKPQGPLSKTWFSLAGEGDAKYALKILRPHEQGLFNYIMLIETSKPSIEGRIVLGEDRFVVDEGIGQFPVPFTSTLLLASAGYKESSTAKKERHTILIETQKDTEIITETELKEITNFLIYRLPGNLSHPGVLQCLGYRMTPKPELVFTLPDNIQVQTLQTLIAADVGKDYGGGHPLDYRLRLARQVSLAVLTVHTAGLVHKNIRTETILVLKPNTAPQEQYSKSKIGFGNPYLTEWRLLRDANALSKHRAIASQWHENIYRHPERQGLKIQKDYNMGHDIYSLGVCLLEVGLWDPLVRTRTASGQPEVSDFFKRVAMLSEFAAPEEVKRSFSNASKVKDLLISVALRYLPSRMGLAYLQLVVACLKVLDSPSGLSEEITDFAKLSDMEKGLAFKELVLSSFTSGSF